MVTGYSTTISLHNTDFFYLLHWFEQCLSVILECHDQLQLGAS